MSDERPIETRSTSTGRVEPGDVEIGRRIHAFRRNRRMSLADLGQAVGVSYQQIQKYEKGDNRAGVIRLQAIAGVLGVSLADLLGATSEDTPWSSDPQVMRVAMDFASISDPVIRANVAALVTSLAESRLGHRSEGTCSGNG